MSYKFKLREKWEIALPLFWYMGLKLPCKNQIYPGRNPSYAHKQITQPGQESQAFGRKIYWESVLTNFHNYIPGLILAFGPGLVQPLAGGSHWGIGLLGFERSPLSPVMLAILLGVFAATLVKLPPALSPGLTFTVKKVLRLGIIFLGIRLTVFDVIELGAFGVPIVILCILGALLITTRLNQGLQPS